MEFINIKKIRPDVYDKIESVDRTLLEEYYKELIILTDISDKSYDNKDISSPYIAIINNSYVIDYFKTKYSIENQPWLDFILEVNKLVGKINSIDIDVLIKHIDEISTVYFKKLIPLENVCDKSLIETIGVEVIEGISDYDIITALFSEITYDLLNHNVIRKGLILEIIIDGIAKGQSLNDIKFRIIKLFENDEY